MVINLREAMALPACGGRGLFPAMATVGAMGKGMNVWWGCGGTDAWPSPTTGQASLDPMGLGEGEMATQAIIATHGAWRQWKLADAHWPSAVQQLVGLPSLLCQLGANVDHMDRFPRLDGPGEVKAKQQVSLFPVVGTKDCLAWTLRMPEGRASLKRCFS